MRKIKVLPETDLRAGDPVLYLNHVDIWIDAGIVIDGVVRWQFGEGSKPVLRVLADFGKGGFELELDVRRLKLDPSAALDGFVRGVYRKPV